MNTFQVIAVLTFVAIGSFISGMKCSTVSWKLYMVENGYEKYVIIDESMGKTKLVPVHTNVVSKTINP